MTFRTLLLAALLSAGPAFAQTPTPPDPAIAAQTAARNLSAATKALDAAQSASDRVKALTETIRAFEDGLAAMRDGLRQASIREQTLSRELHARESEIGQLIAVLQTIGDQRKPTLLLHPDGPLGTARAGMILADVTPALNTRAAELRSKLVEVSTLHKLQQSAADTMRDGLHAVQKARITLSQAVAERTDLPRRFTEDPVKTALLIASSETLSGFASGLSEIADNEAPGSLPDISARKGKLPLPVQGRLLRGYIKPDAAGIKRPGIIMATRPRAIVTTPAAATIRYRGPLLDYGNVMILEPQNGLLFVLAGLDVVYGATGEVLPAGAPVGLMGGTDPKIGDILTQSSEGAGTDRTETLYIEVRENNEPVDPSTWFHLAKES
jgi:septal ring factor EnvC (AmiA/AmiB activator)